MKRSLPVTTEDTLLLGVWVAEGRAAVTGALIDVDGNTVPDALALCAPLWPALAQALKAGEQMDVRHVFLFTNDGTLVQALSPPFAPPAPTGTKRVWYSRTEFTDVGTGGDPHHWQALRLLGGRWGGRFRVRQAADIPGARALWEAQRQ